MLKPLLDKVIRPGVSDLHLKANEPPLIRHMGKLLPVGSTPMKAEDIEAILLSMISEKQREDLNASGSLDFSYGYDGQGRLRVNVYRQRGTFAMAIRIVPAEIKSFTDLHLPGETLERLCQVNRGLILLSGVTGAGKTTTLNAMINYMNENFSYNIITIEDPIEFSHVRKKSSISQREVGRDISSFSEGLRHILRQDPDVIVLGEVNSAEAFHSAIEGAGSGHLVLATIHSSDTMDAVDRIVNAFDFQVQSYVRGQLTNVLRAVMSQRLVPDKTNRGVLPATEVLFATLQMKKLLLTNSVAEARFLMEKGGAFGMHSFDQDLIRLVEEGQVTPQEAMNSASNPNDVRIKLQSQAGPGIELK